MTQLSAEECGVFQEKLFKFPGFYIQRRTIRQYNYNAAAHVLGDIAEVSKGDIEADDYYVRGPNRITALPMEVPVCYQEVAHCLEKSIAKIETAILSALEQTPPELYADIVLNGIYLSLIHI